MNVTSVSLTNKKISFGGHKKYMDTKGDEVQKFFLPYDSSKYIAEVLLYEVEKDRKGGYKIKDGSESQPFKLNEKGQSEEIVPEDVLGTHDQFAYRFRLTDKNDSSKKRYVFDPGTVTNIFDEKNENKYNIVFNNRAIVNKDGKMQLIMVDQYYPGYVRDKETGEIKMDQALRNKALSSVRTHTNKLGGNFLGVIKQIDKLAKEGYTRIVGMPFTKDTLSSHLYWTQNAFQVSPQLGDIDDFKEMQTELFKKGMNWVADAALVNEGLEGVHFSHLLKWGKQSPYFTWFKSNGLDNGVYTLGILPKKAQTAQFVKYKLVNAPFLLQEGLPANKNYNPKLPTHVQFFDERLASEGQKKNNELIETYDNNNTDNTFDITGHNDTIYPYHFEINPEDFAINLKQYKKEHTGSKIDFQNIETIKKLMKFENFKIDEKDEGGFENWDGNTDIAKLNFYYGNSDNDVIKKLPLDEQDAMMDKYKTGVCQVQDYAVTSGKYWTKLVADMQFEYLEKCLRGTEPTVEAYMAKIESEVKAGNIPASALKLMDKDVITNILNSSYTLRRLESQESPQDFILRNAMDFQIDSLPVASDLLGVLTSPYISKRAAKEEEIGVSRFDIYKNGNKNVPSEFKKVYSQSDEFYTKQIAPFVTDALSSLNVSLYKKNGDLNDTGKYIVQEIVPELTKYALLKSLNNSVDIKIKGDGTFDYSNVKSDDITLASLNINGISPDDEAQSVLKAMSNGMKVLSSDAEKTKIKEALSKRLKGADANAYKVAEAIIDRTESGLNWRIDAAKDVSSIDAVRKNDDNIEQAWDSAIKFWKAFNKEVNRANPHAYTTAEITDLYLFIGKDGVGRFKDSTDAETKFIEETGITTTANYPYFYSLLPQMYTKSAETGNTEDEFGRVKPLKVKIDGVDSGWDGNPGFLFQSPLDGVLHSYTFIGNHDKPRPLHFLALDMELFHYSFSKEHSKDYSQDNSLNDNEKKTKYETREKFENIAADVLGKNKSQIEFESISPEAIAMGQRLKQAFAKVCTDTVTKDIINSAIAELANGNFKGKPFDAKAFGVRPFEIVIKSVFEEASRNSEFKLEDKDKDTLEAKVIENILLPAYDKYYSIYKTLVTLPGDVTDFAGDKVSSTGYETKAKNYEQQNRNIIHHEWLEDPNRAYTKTFYDNMNGILSLRNNTEKYGEKLSALNDGIPVSLPLKDENFYSLLRYNDRDSVTITLYNANGANAENTEKMNRETDDAKKPQIFEIQLGSDRQREGLAGGLPIGTKFKSTRDGDNSTYVVEMAYGAPVLRRRNSQGQPIPMTIEPQDYNALVLYKD